MVEIFSDETVRDLYGIEKGSFNASLGTVELSPPEGEIRAFVIGGAGSGIPFYRALRKKGIPFAAGILHGNDIDLAVARPLAGELVVTAPFAAVSEEDIRKAEEIIGRVMTVIDCGAPAGELNGCNKELLRFAEEKGKKIVRSLAGLEEAGS